METKQFDGDWYSADKQCRANRIRKEIAALTDDELISFKCAVYSGDDIKGNTFETVDEFIKRVAKELNDSLPF